MPTTLVIWLVLITVLAVLLGLTALAFRGGRTSGRPLDAAQRGDGRGGDQTYLTTRNRMHGL